MAEQLLLLVVHELFEVQELLELEKILIGNLKPESPGLVMLNSIDLDPVLQLMNDIVDVLVLLNNKVRVLRLINYVDLVVDDDHAVEVEFVRLINDVDLVLGDDDAVAVTVELLRLKDLSHVKLVVVGGG